MSQCCSTVTFAHSKSAHFSFYSVVRQSQTLDVLRSTTFFFDIGLQHAHCCSADLFIQNCSQFGVVCSYNTVSLRPLYCFELSFAVFISWMIFQLIHHSFPMKYSSSTKSNRSLDLKKKVFFKKGFCLSSHCLQDVKTNSKV